MMDGEALNAYQALVSLPQDNLGKFNSLGGKFQFNITGDDGGSFFVDASDSGPQVSDSGNDPQCTITMKSSDFVDLLAGKSNPQSLMMTGELRVSGNMNLVKNISNLSGIYRR